jgi:hypothetical protein
MQKLESIQKRLLNQGLEISMTALEKIEKAFMEKPLSSDNNGSNDSCLKMNTSDKPQMSNFDRLISRAVLEQGNKQRQLESDLRVASSIILEKAGSSLPPDEYTILEHSLVKLYMLCSK